MDYSNQFFSFSHLLYVCFELGLFNLLYVSIQAWLSVWIVTLPFGDIVSKAVAIAVVFTLVEEGQFSTPVTCQLSRLGPLVYIQAAPIVTSC